GRATKRSGNPGPVYRDGHGRNVGGGRVDH
ncbi:MAG: hypothetical protein AVDCRST_MAG14-536, partial [uncultured Rubrobacteraceae bacterium]